MNHVETPSLPRDKTDAPGPLPRFLLVGYNGANNTGSEARLLSIIDDIRAVVGEETPITVPTLNERNLRRYLSEDEHLRIVAVPSIFFASLRRLVRRHDVVMLVEGSCYMDTWTSALLWAFLCSTRYAADMGKPSIAYAVDSGDLSASNRRRAVRDASRTDLILLRSRAAMDRMESWGVEAEILVTGDCAFTFQPDGGDGGILRDHYGGRVAGLAMVDFYLWPVVIRPFGRRANCYRWPYYYSRSGGRRKASRELARRWAAQADRLVEEHAMEVALIVMEGLDEPFAREVRGLMRDDEGVQIFSSNRMNASQMTLMLRDLDLLITSRYHASVLSLASGVPQVAIGHDLRLKDLYHEMGVGENHFPHDTDGLWEALSDRVNGVLSSPEDLRSKLLRGYEEQVGRARKNREILRDFLKARVII